MDGTPNFRRTGDADLDAARTFAYQVLSGAVHSIQPSSPRPPAQEELESLKSWALVHGPSTMINEGTIAPHIYGAHSARELISVLLNSPHLKNDGGAHIAGKNRKERT